MRQFGVSYREFLRDGKMQHFFKSFLICIRMSKCILCLVSTNNVSFRKIIVTETLAMSLRSHIAKIYIT